MLEVVLFALLAQSPSTPATEAELLKLAAEARQHREDERYEEAVEVYSRILNAASNPTWEANALGPRAWLSLQLERPTEALADAERYAELFPNAEFALELQAQALEQLGRPDAADAVRQRIVDMQSNTALDSGWDGEQRVVAAGPLWRSPLLIWAAVMLLMLINVWIGRRQKREGNGTWWRLLWVAVVIAAMQLAPLLVVSTLMALNVPGFTAGLASLSFCIPCVFYLFLVLGPTVRFVSSKEALPLAGDETLLAHVAELAGRMNIKTPVVRLLPTGGGELQAQAFAGGMVAPSLVVGDGILHRLSADERNATIGHELAHLANHSVWFLVAIMPVAMTSALLVASWTSFGMALALGFSLFVGLRRLVSRHFEYDCDRRAAEANGFRTTISALRKIHAANPFRDSGWLSYVLYATATHPSRAERLGALYDAAPAADRPPITWCQQERRRRQRVGRLATLIWSAAIIVLPLWSVLRPESVWPTPLLVVVGLIPWTAILIESRIVTREARRRMVARRRDRRWVPVSLLLLLVVCVLFGSNFGISLERFADHNNPAVRLLVPLGMMVVTLLLFIWSVRGFNSRGDKLLQQASFAMQTRDFGRLFQLAADHPKEFDEIAFLRHILGFALAMSGRRNRAVEVLDSLRRDEPGFTESVLVLAMTHLDEGRPEAALELIEEVQEKLPDDPTPLMLRGSVLRHLGRLDEAQACVDRALELKPHSGNTYAVAAWIALDRGLRERSKALLVTAEEHDPATAFIEYVKAQVALAGDDPQAALRQVERAVSASDANPYSLMQNQVRALAERVGAATR